METEEKTTPAGSFKCKGCGHVLPLDFSLKTEGYCYMCDPHITLEELQHSKAKISQYASVTEGNNQWITKWTDEVKALKEQKRINPKILILLIVSLSINLAVAWIMHNIVIPICLFTGMAVIVLLEMFGKQKRS